MSFELYPGLFFVPGFARYELVFLSLQSTAFAGVIVVEACVRIYEVGLKFMGLMCSHKSL
jgi:hypothetical protein